MKSFSFIVPQEIKFGGGSIETLPKILETIKSETVLLISDRGLERLGVVQKIVDICTRKSIKVNTFLDVEPNPSTDTVDKATAEFKKNGSTSIVALGGGSPMDVAKAVAALVTHGGSIISYEGADKLPHEVVPIVAIPTTAGTGSETTPFTVITDHSRNYKLTVYSYKLIPRYAILDSDLIMSLPPFVAATTGVDAFIHAMESYLSNDASPFSDAMGEKAMELIGKNIRAFVANRNNREAADAMLVGSMFAGIAFSWARLGNIHAMSHPISAYFNVAHGVANSVLMPTILKYNEITDTGRYEKIYNYIKKDKYLSTEEFKASMLAEEIRVLLKDFNIPDNLADVQQIVEAGGIDDETIRKMSEDAMLSGNILANPRASTVRDIENLYRVALKK